MHTKEKIETLKKQDLPALYEYIQSCQNETELLFILKNLGKIPTTFNGDVFVSSLDSKHNQIRFWAVKNLGKLKNVAYLEALADVAKQDSDSMVRREAISSIGRMRERNIISILLDFLVDPDPKVVIQAIRGLLTFKYNPLIQEKLKALSDHPNELIQAVIAKEFLQNGSNNRSTMPHPASPDFMKNVVVHGDVQEILRAVPNEAVHLTFTSPPYYNARDYSIYKSYSAYLDFLTAVFEEIHRVTKEGRFFVLNTSPIIIPRISRAYSSKRYPIPFDIHPRLIDMGWEFIDDIVWAKPEVTVKNRNAGFLQHRKPLAYKPNPTTEYLMVYRKKTEKLLDWNIRQYDRAIVERSKVLGKYETSNLWQIDPKSDKVHSAIFPPELCRRVIVFYSYIGDLIFDPFAGSGTLGKAAQSLERHFFLTEQDDVYFKYIRGKLGEKTLFDSTSPHFMNLHEFQQLAESIPE